MRIPRYEIDHSGIKKYLLLRSNLPKPVEPIPTTPLIMHARHHAALFPAVPEQYLNNQNPQAFDLGASDLGSSGIESSVKRKLTLFTQ